MAFIEKKQKQEYLLALIEKGCTGSVGELSGKIGVSKRTVLRYIDELREMGHQIGFCLQRRTYYLIERGKVKNNCKENIKIGTTMPVFVTGTVVCLWGKEVRQDRILLPNYDAIHIHIYTMIYALDELNFD